MSINILVATHLPRVQNHAGIWCVPISCLVRLRLMGEAYLTTDEWHQPCCSIMALTHVAAVALKLHS